MSAFMVPESHIDLLIATGLQLGRMRPYASPVRWYDVPLSDRDADRAACYAIGQPWGPEALRWHDEHIQELTPRTAGRVGAMLLAENARSVNHRYAEDTWEPAYEYREIQSPLALGVGAIIKAIDCYEYQACEHEEWHRSEAAAFCDSLRRRVAQTAEEYDDAPTWTYDAPRGARLRYVA